MSNRCFSRTMPTALMLLIISGEGCSPQPPTVPIDPSTTRILDRHAETSMPTPSSSTIVFPRGDLPLNANIIDGLTLSPDNRLLVWMDRKADQCRTRIWSFAERRELPPLTVTDEGAALTFSSCGKMLALSSQGGPIELWDTGTWKQTAAFGMRKDGHPGATCLAFSRQGGQLASGRPGGSIYIRDIAAKKDRRLGTIPAFATNAMFSSDGVYLAASSFDGDVKVWEMGSGTERWSFRAHIHPVSKRVGIQGLAILPDNRTLVTAGTDGMVRCWDIPSRKETQQFDAKVGEVNAMAVTPDGKLLAVAGGNSHNPTGGGLVRLWSLAGKRQVGSLSPLKEDASHLCFSHDGRYLVAATCGDRGQIFIWSIADCLSAVDR